MLLIFAFTINWETKEAAFSGNVEPAVALKVLQDIVIADAVKKAEATGKKAEKPAEATTKKTEKLAKKK